MRRQATQENPNAEEDLALYVGSGDIPEGIDKLLLNRGQRSDEVILVACENHKGHPTEV